MKLPIKKDAFYHFGNNMAIRKRDKAYCFERNGIMTADYETAFINNYNDCIKSSFVSKTNDLDFKINLNDGSSVLGKVETEYTMAVYTINEKGEADGLSEIQIIDSLDEKIKCPGTIAILAI